MNITQTPIDSSRGIRLAALEDGQEIGHAFLYVLHNDSRETPFALLEDVLVREDWRERGVGSALVGEVIALATQLGCYKIIGTSRYARAEVHAWYERLGFKDYGKEFRMDLIM